MSISKQVVSISQVNASLPLSDRLAFGVLTKEVDGLKADNSVKSVLIHWVLQPVFNASNKLAFFRLSYVAPKGKDKGSLIESARLQPSKQTGFTVTYQSARESTVDAIAQFTTLERATEYVQNNVLPPIYYQLAFVYANTAQSQLTDDESLKVLTTATPEIWQAAIESGNRLLPQFFKPAIAETTVEATLTETKPAIAIMNGKTAK